LVWSHSIFNNIRWFDRIDFSLSELENISSEGEKKEKTLG